MLTDDMSTILIGSLWFQSEQWKFYEEQEISEPANSPDYELSI